MPKSASPLPPSPISPAARKLRSFSPPVCGRVFSGRLWSPAAAGVQIRGLLRRIRVSLGRISVGAAPLHLGTLGSPSPSPPAGGSAASLGRGPWGRPPLRLRRRIAPPVRRRLGAVVLAPARGLLLTAGALGAPGGTFGRSAAGAGAQVSPIASVVSPWLVVVAPIPWMVDVVHGLPSSSTCRCSLWIYFAPSGEETSCVCV